MLGEATLDVWEHFSGETIRLFILFAAQHWLKPTRVPASPQWVGARLSSPAAHSGIRRRREPSRCTTNFYAAVSLSVVAIPPPRPSESTLTIRAPPGHLTAAGVVQCSSRVMRL